VPVGVFLLLIVAVRVAAALRHANVTVEDKRKILGLNSAKLYGIKGVEKGNLSKRFKPVPKDYESRMSTKLKTILEFPGYTNDKMATLKHEYEEAGAQPSRTRYGWIRAKA